MRTAMLLPITSIALAWASLASAQEVIESLSFGHKHPISSNTVSIPGWSIIGEGHVPQILSDKVILTPPYGGNKRGAVWTEGKSSIQDWTGTLEFRAGGVDHGKGNLALWYVKSGNAVVSKASIYTVGKFDGLALVVDTNNGVPKIRGFLNDGSIEYRNHANVDSLAFGHCDYNYRNLGRPSKLQVKTTADGFQVLIDDRKCFSTKQVTLPSSDYGFGITAASADPPDSLEVFKFTVAPAAGNISPPEQRQEQRQEVPVQVDHQTNFGTSDAAYQTLTERINTLEKSLSNTLTELYRHTQAEEGRYQEIINLLKTPPSAGGTSNQNAILGNLESRLSSLDRTLSSMSTSISSDLKSSFNHDEKFAQISKQLQQTHEGLTDQLPGKLKDYVQNHTPRIGFIVFTFMAFQSCCLAVLLWQKWRKGMMPKKFL